MLWLSVIIVSLLYGNIIGNRFWDRRLLTAYSSTRDQLSTLNDENQFKFVSDENSNKPTQSSNHFTYKILNTFEHNPDCQDLVDIGCTYGCYIIAKSDALTVAAIKSLDNLNADGLKRIEHQSKVPKLLTNAEYSLLTLPENLNAKRFLPFLPISYYNEFYDDLVVNVKQDDFKRNKNITPPANCDCKVKNDLIDLGSDHFPRFLLNAICQNENSANEYESKCVKGAYCRPLEYKVKVLTFRMDHVANDNTFLWLPDDLRNLWKFKTITVAAGCFCGA